MRRRVVLLVPASALLLLSGCAGLEPVEREKIIAEAGEAAYVQAYDAVLNAALDQGLSEAAATEVATKAAIKARALAERSTEKALPEKTKGGLWAALSQVLLFGLSLASGRRVA